MSIETWMCNQCGTPRTSRARRTRLRCGTCDQVTDHEQVVTRGGPDWREHVNAQISLSAACALVGMRPLFVDDLPSRAVLLKKYGLVLVDDGASPESMKEISKWVRTQMSVS